LEAYKKKHGHLNVRRNEDGSLYSFCNNVRRSRQAIIAGEGTQYKLTDDRIAALDAIGFDWQLETIESNRTVRVSFLSKVDELKAYKEEHGHLNVKKKEDQRLYDFCIDLRQSRRAITAGKGKIHYRLDDDSMAALDAIGFEWKHDAQPSKRIDFNDRVNELEAYKKKHGHLNVHWKEDKRLYSFCDSVRRSRQAIIAGEGKIYTKLDDNRIAALDAIGFVWANGAINAEEAHSPPTNLTTVEAGKAILIMVAPNERLGLTIAIRPGSYRGARIDAIKPGCPFADEVTVGDTIITINDKEVMTNVDFTVGLDRTRKLGIIQGSMQGDMGTKVETDVCVENYETSTNIDHSGENLPERSRKLNLVPMSRLECEQALLANKITYPEPEYLVAGGPSEYDITRDTITLEDKDVVKLGRNDLTNITWTALSRDLCDISFESNMAYVTMNRVAAQHAVFLNGRELNRPVGTKIRLRDSVILSLYGPTGFAYRLNLV
jgi:hypothetical protein